MKRPLASKQAWLFGICLLLLVPAFWINLGLLPVFGDEPIRGQVALEMLFSDNWVAPTLNGELYFKKPPFYNWLLAGTIQLFGEASEWVLRLPSIVPLFLYGLTLYLVFKPYTGRKTALLTALLFLTCGRFIIYSSLLGHIDFFYAWITFGSFMWIFYMYEKQQWVLLFAGSYTLAAVGFLCKGMPSIVFQGLTLIAWFAYQGRFKRLFYWQHFAGGFWFLGLISVYAYFYQQSGSLEELMSTLWSQSSKRTILEQPIGSTIFHLLTYPFQMLYHVLPWSLLTVFVFRRDWLQHVRRNRLLCFALVTLVSNIWVYWISPATLPRYIFMLYPFLFLLLTHFYRLSKLNNTFKKWHSGFEALMAFAAIVIALSFWIPLFKPSMAQAADWLPWEAALFTLLMLIALGFYWQWPRERLVITIAVMLIMRMAFSTFVLPARLADSKDARLRESATQVASISKGRPLHLLTPTSLSLEQSFYLTRDRKAILNTVSPDTLQQPEGYYIGSDSALAGLEYKLECHFKTKKNDQTLYLVTLEGQN